MIADDKYKGLFENLEFRLDNINRAMEDTQNHIHKNEAIANCLQEISFFVYAIFSNQEFKKIILNICNYYSDAVNRLGSRYGQEYNELLNEIGDHLQGEPDFEEIHNIFQSQNKVYFFCLENMNLTIKEYLIQISRISSDCPIDKMMKIKDTLSHIINDWYQQKKSNTLFEPIKLKFDRCREIDGEINFETQYSHDFNFVSEVCELYDIYSVHDPRTDIPRRNENPMLYYYKSGNYLNSENIKKYYHSCQKLYNYLKLKHEPKQYIFSIIDKFRCYCELYMDFTSTDKKEFLPTNREAFFQKEFEKFLFYHGVYPISEAQIGSGRLDTLGVNREYAILFEIKQIGFDSKISSNEKNNLKKAFNQTPIYVQRLKVLNNFCQDVHIIIFSGKLIRLSPSSPIIIDGINYHYWILELSATPPSKQKPTAIQIEL